MKRKRYVVMVSISLLCSSLGFAQTTSLNDVHAKFDVFSEALAKSLPFNASVGLNWSDAYIGQLFDMPPHFGVGVSGGATTIDFDAVTGVLEPFGIKPPIPFIPLPAYVIEGRIGGFIIPFDIGVKFGMLPDVSLLKEAGVDTNFLLAGADFRYGLIKQGAILPNVSIGLGVNYLKGGISASIGNEVSFSFQESSSHTLKLTKPRVGVSWETLTLEMKGQVSKSFLIVTPYIGVGVSYAVLSKVNYGVKTHLTYDGKKIDANAINEIKEAIPGLQDIGDNGFSSSYTQRNSWGMRVFGGLAFNLAIIKLDITGMFNILDQNYGLTLGIRAQL
jgi:hypothetical protein